ncbi:hypothetical protein [Butyrivibrio proteoclasticus]|uniref:hypothetical protein n=1 Tax=Butyrivibrio proteoclasticus TaxID=43305 RepID=UPI000A423596|nr:hypothetical protein [Butyrivibrio proteoclasticus]
MSNGSLDFLDMIKNQSAGGAAKAIEPVISREISTDGHAELIAVIDTETNWLDQVMSIGVAIADSKTFKCLDKRYYIFEPEVYVGGIYSNVLHVKNVQGISCSRQQALSDIRQFFLQKKISKIFAYNAKFDYNHLEELSSFDWFDIMRIAAYKQFNKAIPDSQPCCKTGRLKSNYGVEPIMRMLSGNNRYYEVHNAVLDAVDELKIVELLGHDIETYQCGKIS